MGRKSCAGLWKYDRFRTHAFAIYEFQPQMRYSDVAFVAKLFLLGTPSHSLNLYPRVLPAGVAVYGWCGAQWPSPGVRLASLGTGKFSFCEE